MRHTIEALLLSAALAGCSAPFQSPPSPSASSGTGIAALFPSGATIVDTKTMGNSTAVVMALPVGAPRGSLPAPPPDAELAVASSTPAGWRLNKAVVQQFAQAPELTVAQVAGVPAAGMAFHTGANSAGLVVIRNDAVVYDGVADSVQLQDLDGDGWAEVVKAWSPFCRSHADSPPLHTVYAWIGGAFVPATDHFPNLVAQDAASFQAAVARANSSQTTPAWDAASKACLHDSLAYLAQLAGDAQQAAAEKAQVRQLDPAYDVDAVAKAAAGEPAQTMPVAR
ncbi:MAG TPA: hypothetical protein VK009_06135 [Chloroflexota bacterium]|nr:hypothetical protein [Chloroflexota bacterium]